MGQLLQGGRCHNDDTGCESWQGLCSKHNVNALVDGVRGCLEARRKGKNKERQYYDHIDGVSYLIHHKIGGGEYSEVFEANRTNTSRKTERFAVKVYRSRNLERQRTIREEIRILQKLGGGCKEIVRLHRYQESLDPETGTLEVKMVLDLCTGGTLRKLLKTVPLLEEHKTRIIAFQLVQALHFLHTRRVMHCDVKPENVLFVDSGSLAVKLSDFGSAKTSPDGLAPPRSTALNSPDIYVAPEVLQETGYGTPVDMWALGITLYQCLTGRFPFQNGTTLTMQIIEEICSGSFVQRALSSEMFPESVSLNALLFLEKLLRVDPNERMNVVEALNHKWLKSGDGLDPNMPLQENSAGIGPGNLVETIPSRPEPPQFIPKQFSKLLNRREIFDPEERPDRPQQLFPSYSTTASSPTFEMLRTTTNNRYEGEAIQAFNQTLQNGQLWDYGEPQKPFFTGPSTGARSPSSLSTMSHVPRHHPQSQPFPFEFPNHNPIDPPFRSAHQWTFHQTPLSRTTSTVGDIQRRNGFQFRQDCWEEGHTTLS